MKSFNLRNAAISFATLLAGAAMLDGVTNAQAQMPVAMPFDTPMTIFGVETVCTGIGIDTRSEPRWDTYPLKVEIAGKGGQYLGDVEVVVIGDEGVMLEAECGGPWLLFKLPAGRYQVRAPVDGQTVSSSAFVSAGSQGRIILRFPELGGAVEAKPG